MKPVQTTIDVTDWAEMALRLEEVPQNEDDLFALAVDRGFSAREAAQFAIACRILGKTPKDILPEDKVLLGDGGSIRVHTMIGQRKRRIEINGQEYDVREATAVHNVPDEEGDDAEFEAEVESILPDDGYVRVGTEQSYENALRYLRCYVPGHIWNRLAEIKAADGDVRSAADELIVEINGMVERLG